MPSKTPEAIPSPSFLPQTTVSIPSINAIKEVMPAHGLPSISMPPKTSHKSSSSDSGPLITVVVVLALLVIGSAAAYFLLNRYFKRQRAKIAANTASAAARRAIGFDGAVRKEERGNGGGMRRDGLGAGPTQSWNREPVYGGRDMERGTGDGGGYGIGRATKLDG